MTQAWDFIVDLKDCHERLAVWATYNRGGMPAPDIKSCLPDNKALTKPDPGAREIRVPLVVDGERQRDEKGHLIRVPVILQVSALGKESRRGARVERVEWPEDVDRMSRVVGVLRSTDAWAFKLIALEYFTNYTSEHKAEILGLKGKYRRRRYEEKRSECWTAVRHLWNGIVHQMAMGVTPAASY